ncbi:hypothetical protein [Rhizosaccharibacter radicis]|uniref:DUF2946 domain-containing protein n=1 Tax=Rhizosaccharibacter radicis TaxID=2782605 RepID=A0ABT1VZI4_9PROT|nr:hypothetical protein [Acetobacteraceae bacterium KSS12]
MFGRSSLRWRHSGRFFCLLLAALAVALQLGGRSLATEQAALALSVSAEPSFPICGAARAAVPADRRALSPQHLAALPALLPMVAEAAPPVPVDLDDGQGARHPDPRRTGAGPAPRAPPSPRAVRPPSRAPPLPA